MSYSYSWSSSGCGGRRMQWSYGNCQQSTQQLQPTTPSPSQSSSLSIDADSFEEEMLKAHNDYRAKHGSPPLKLNKEISKFSMNWAKTIAARNVMQHSQGSGYGENICYLHENDCSAKKAVDLWYSEIQQYTYGTNHFSMSTGHFTQVVWKASEELGVGWAKSAYNTIYIVANYNPPGNYQGKFVENLWASLNNCGPSLTFIALMQPGRLFEFDMPASIGITMKNGFCFYFDSVEPYRIYHE